jgi:hypothetical protein
VSHPLDSARERLKRADENIRLLNAEIIKLLAGAPVVDFEGENPTFSQEESERFEALKNFIRDQTVQPRFSVLAGEILHHLRSAFDHLAWQLSSPDQRLRFPTRIEFPVFSESEHRSGEKKLCRYCRKVEGIISPTALTRIDSLQPYKRVDPLRDPLWIIHDLDRIDKHRHLVLAIYTMNVNVSGFLTFEGVGEHRAYEIWPRSFKRIGPPKMEVRGKMSAQVTFREFSKRNDEPIFPMLQNLLRFATKAVESFAGEFS